MRNSAAVADLAVQASQTQATQNLRRLNFLNFFWSFLVVQAVVVPFFKSRGLNFAQIFSIQAVFTFTGAVLEIPTGYFSDRFGRRSSLVLAALLKGLGGTTLVVWQSYPGFLFAYVLIGIANSFLSGSDIALIYESLPSSADPTREAHHQLSLRSQFVMAGIGLSALASVFFLSFSFDWVIRANAAIAWVPFLWALSLKRVRASALKSTGRPNAANLLKSFCSLIGENNEKRLLVTQLVSFGLLASLWPWSFQSYWKEMGISVALFGFLVATENFVSVFASRKSLFLIHHLGEFRLSFVAPLSLVLAALAPGWVGVAFGILGAASLTVLQISRRRRLNDLLQADLRATENSLVNFITKTLYLGIGPILGKLFDLRGCRGAFVGVGILFVALQPLLWKQTLKSVERKYYEI